MTHPDTLRPTRPGRLAMLWLVALIVALPAGCGGGVGTGGTGSFAAGPITGFGSVIVNDVRFDDSVAQVEDAEGDRRSREELRLGMTVEIDSDAIQSTAGGATASAARIRFQSELLGPVAAVDSAGSSFVVLGQRVVVDETTVFDEGLAGGLGALAVGRLVEVYAGFDAAGARFRATRVEPRASAEVYRIRGLVAQLDAAARLLRIGNTVFDYGGAGAVPAELAAGQFVRLRLQAASALAPRWQVLSFGTALRPINDAEGIKLKGLISVFSSASSFSLAGRPVDASAALFPDGAAGLALGVRVEVEGSVRAGVLRATRVAIHSDAQERERGFELKGAISAVNAAQRSFVLRGLVISTARADLRFDDGTAADLLAGRRVQVRGQLAADRTRIEATRIKFE